MGIRDQYPGTAYGHQLKTIQLFVAPLPVSPAFSVGKVHLQTDYRHQNFVLSGMKTATTLEPPSDEKQLEQLYKELLACWNNSDAQGYANLFTENANVIGFDGSQLNGKAQIESSLRQIFKDHTVASYVSIVEEVRSIGSCAYLLRAVVGMIPPGGHDIMSERNAIQSMVAMKEEDKFAIVLFHNTPAAFHGRADLSEKLTERLRRELKNN